MGYGGYGQAANGRSQFGSAASDIEPRYEISRPARGQRNVPRDIWITFRIYYYSSFPDLYGEGLSIAISEDSGATFLDASQAPYELTYRPRGGQSIWVKIRKIDGILAENSEIVIRYEGKDEFLQDPTDNALKRWI